VSWAITNYLEMPVRFLVTGAASVVTATLFIWLFALERDEKAKVVQYIQRKS
jgi:hypothetical protein